MGWYKNGSVSLVQGNNQVVGVGTDFVANVNPGAIFCGPDGRIYEVDFITSATLLSLVRSYAGTSVSGTAYAIAPTQSYIVDLARQATALLNTFGSLREDYEAGNLVGAGLKLKGVLADPSALPAEPAEGDSYLVGSSIYVWAKTRWDHSSIQGPKGDVGDVNPANLEAATSALDAKGKAAISAGQAQGSATAAAGSAATAAGSASAAAASATSSAGAATTASDMASAAAESASAAATSAQQARDAATQAHAGQVQADWTQTDPADKGYIAHKPVLAAVATSGNKADVGLPYVDNTSDANKPVSAATQTALNGKVNTSSLGIANGVATLGADGKVPAAQLPSYVDDVVEAATSASFPAIGEAGKIYVALNNNKTYRWGGSAYAEIAASPGSTDAVAEGSTNRYFTENRVLATLLAGLSSATNAVIAAGDSVLIALGKLQAQVSALVTGKADKSTTIAGYGITDAYTKTSVDSALAGKQANLGYTPVQQGGGIGQGTNKVYMGWGASGGGLKVTIDGTDQNYIPFSSTIPSSGTINFSGNICGDYFTSRNTIYAQSANNLKIGLYDSATIRGYISATSTICFGAINAANTLYTFTVDNSGNTTSTGTHTATNHIGPGTGLTGTAPSLTAGNASSISSAAGGSYTFTGSNTFWNLTAKVNTGNGSYGGNGGANSPFRFMSDDGGGAWFAFLRSGMCGVNFGLDSDNILRYGGWSLGASLFSVDTGGNLWMSGNVTAFSDETLKTNWREIAPGFVERWAEVTHGVFDRIDNGLTQVGLSAQSVQKVLPHAVCTMKNKKLSLNYGAAAAVASIQLAKEVLSLRKELAEQKALIKLALERGV